VRWEFVRRVVEDGETFWTWVDRWRQAGPEDLVAVGVTSGVETRETNFIHTNVVNVVSPEHVEEIISINLADALDAVVLVHGTETSNRATFIVAGKPVGPQQFAGHRENRK
jgi:arginase family enzyme